MLDMFTGQSVQVAQHSEPVKAVRWVESPNGSYLVTGSWDKTIKVWDIGARAAVSTVQDTGEVWSVSWRPQVAVGSSGAFVSGGEDGVARWWRSAGAG